MRYSTVSGEVAQMRDKKSKGRRKRMLVVHQSSWTAESLIEFKGRSTHRNNLAKCVCILSRCTIYILLPTEHQHLSQPSLFLTYHDRSLSRSPHHDNHAYERSCGFEVISSSTTVIQPLRFQFLFLESSNHASKAREPLLLPRV